MKDYPQMHRRLYQAEWNKAVNRFEREFLLNFSTPDGEIDWDKLVNFNSGQGKPRWAGFKTTLKGAFREETEPEGP
jgi:hypothetical protein